MKHITLLLCLTAGAAQACPVAGDLATGIKITSTGGGEQVFQDMGDNLVKHSSTNPNGIGYENDLLHGTYIHLVRTLQNGVLDQDSVYRTDYPGGLTDIPVPAPDQDWRLATDVTGTRDTYTETQSVQWQERQLMTIGDCNLTFIPGTIRYSNPYGKTTEEIAYFADLGFAILTSYQADNNTPTQYRYDSISALN